MRIDRFLPRERRRTVRDVDYRTLWESGIRGIIFDIDNTLVSYEIFTADEELLGFVDGLRGMGFRLSVVSNNLRARVEEFAASIDVPCFSNAWKPRKKKFIMAADVMGLRGMQVAVIGDQVFTDIWGGNRAGMYTILVDAISDKDTRLVKFKRRLERRILKGMEKL